MLLFESLPCIPFERGRCVTLLFATRRQQELDLPSHNVSPGTTSTTSGRYGGWEDRGTRESSTLKGFSVTLSFEMRRGPKQRRPENGGAVFGQAGPSFIRMASFELTQDVIGRLQTEAPDPPASRCLGACEALLVPSQRPSLSVDARHCSSPRDSLCSAWAVAI